MIQIRASLTCMLCARPVASVSNGRVRALNPDHTEAVRRLRCPYCRGRLWLSDVEQVYVVDRRPLGPEDLNPKRGRPTKAEARVKRTAWDRQYRLAHRHPCLDCPTLVSWNRHRCVPCALRQRREKNQLREERAAS